MTSRKTILLACLLFAAAFAAFAGCARQNRSQPAAYVPPPTPGPPDLRPPQPEEAQQAIKRVYGQAVTIDSERDPSFIAGDLNGDGAPDLAVAVRPAAGKLAELNHEMANWIRRDPRKVVLPDPKVRVHRLSPAPPEPVVIEQNDLLLAVIHGYGPSGWRHPQARQSYLLRNAVGSSLKLQPVDEARRMSASSRQQPQLLGDAIRQTLAGEQGLLYYTGAHYVWHRLEPSSVRDKSQRKG